MHRRWTPAMAVAGALLCLVGTGSGPSSADTAAPDGARVFTSDGTRSDGLAALARMMAIPSSETSYVPAFSTPGADSRAACPPRRCLDRRLPVPEGIEVSDSSVRVLLPKGYHRKKNRGTRYPVVYMLNGALSNTETYTRLTTLTSLSREYRAIFVMPEGGHGSLPGMFSDWYDGSFDWETFHTDVVIPWVDRRFRTVPGGRAAAGVSMGGLGAVLYAERHPGLFKAVLSMSGVLDTTTLVGNALPPTLAESLGFIPPDLSRVWGNPVINRANWSAHNPAENVSKLEGTLVLVSSGTGYPKNDPEDPVHSGYLEQVVWTTNRTFLTRLVADGIPFEARIAQGGVHAYPWFEEPMRWGLPLAIAAAHG